jgi:hypothetical protein
LTDKVVELADLEYRIQHDHQLSEIIVMNYKPEDITSAADADANSGTRIEAGTKEKEKRENNYPINNKSVNNSNNSTNIKNTRRLAYWHHVVVVPGLLGGQYHAAASRALCNPFEILNDKVRHCMQY